MKKTNFEETLEYIRKQTASTPTIGIVLGTGLAGLVDQIVEEKSIAYNFIPHFPLSTVESHFGKLIFGTIGNKNVVAMQGRMHYYEGYSMEQIVYPIRIMKLLGVRSLFLSNACGGLNKSFKKEELMIIDDHINLLPDNPLRGKNLDDMGPRFPDMSAPYDKEYQLQAEKIAKEEGIKVNKGVYVSVPGPNLETRAEYRMLAQMGADVVGMSTVPEVIAGVHMGMRIFAMSVITDECDPDKLAAVSVEEIIAAANAAEPKLTRIISRMISEI